MRSLPPEMLSAIADVLPIDDVRSFRLVCRRFAHAGFPALVRDIAFLNMVENWDNLEALQQSRFSLFGATRHLSVYDAAWPEISSPEEWANHFLFLRSESCGASWTDTQHAYDRYQQFIQAETSRTPEADQQLFFNLIRRFPSLKEVTISHCHAWRFHYLNNIQFRALTQKIWVLPWFESFIARCASRLLPNLQAFPRVQRLNLIGLLDPREVGPMQNTTICHLRVNSIVAGKDLESAIVTFLGSFKSLTRLSVRTSALGPVFEQQLPLSRLQWLHLEFCDLTGAWLSESDILGFIERHCLKRLSLKNVTLVDGRWDSFFTRARELRYRPRISCGGVLAAKDSPAYYLENPESRHLLDSFLADMDMPWPFIGSSQDDVEGLFLDSEF